MSGSCCGAPASAALVTPPACPLPPPSCRRIRFSLLATTNPHATAPLYLLCTVPPRRPESTPPELASLVLLGSRVRQNVLTLHDDAGERVGFAQVEDCTQLAAAWAGAAAAPAPAATPPDTTADT